MGVELPRGGAAESHVRRSKCQSVLYTIVTLLGRMRGRDMFSFDISIGLIHEAVYHVNISHTI
jgi:hypothetical protein